MTRVDVNDMHQRSFTRALRARNLSQRTIETYLEAVKALRQHTGNTDLAEITPEQIRDFLAEQAATRSATTASIRYRALQQFYKWAVEDEVRDHNPMTRIRPPLVPEKPVAVLTLDQVKALLAACSGRSFEDRRDQAIIRLFLEPGGPRLSELTLLTVGDVDLEDDAVEVTGKFRRSRRIWFGSRTGQALERYLRARAKHPHAQDAGLWLGQKGAMTTSGVQQMLRRRASQAGIRHLHPHMLRHTAAHEWLNAGGQEGDALRLFGWRSRQMLDRYGASAKDVRAAEAAKRMRLGDRY